MGQYEIGQKELIDIHHYTFMIDHCSLQNADSNLVSRVHGVNQLLLKHIFVVSFLCVQVEIRRRLVFDLSLIFPVHSNFIQNSHTTIKIITTKLSALLVSRIIRRITVNSWTLS